MPRLLPLCVFLLLPHLALAQEQPDPISTDLANQLTRLEKELEQKRADLCARLESAIETAGEAKERLEMELEGFSVGGILPVSLAKEAREFMVARRNNLGYRLRQLEIAIQRYDSAGATEKADGLRDEAEALQDELDVYSWEDLRLRPNFEAALEKARFTLDKSHIVSPAEGEAVLRLPSPLDGKVRPYELRFEIERIAGTGPLRILLPLANRAEDNPELAALVIDGGGGRTTGLECHRRGSLADNRNNHDGVVLAPDTPVVVVISVRPNRIQVGADQTRVVDCTTPKELTCPESLTRMLGGARSSLHLITDQGSRFRIVSAGYRGLPSAEARATTRATARRKDMPKDQLPLGSVWTGATDKNKSVIARVVQRNQRCETATIELRGAGGWRVRIPVKTNDSGTKMQIGNVRRLDAKVSIFDESGSGAVGSGVMELRWSWKNRSSERRGFYEDHFYGKRR